jgi:hypothetical protein
MAVIHFTLGPAPTNVSPDYYDSSCNAAPASGTGVSVEADGPSWVQNGGRYGVCNDHSVVPVGPGAVGVRTAADPSATTSYLTP